MKIFSPKASNESEANFILFRPFDIFIAVFMLSLLFVGAKHLLPFDLNIFSFWAKNISPLQNSSFVIFADGQRIELPIFTDTTIFKNSVEIRLHDGTAQFIKSDCPNQICVLAGLISQRNRISGQIVCLPNRVSLFIENSSAEVDVYVR